MTKLANVAVAAMVLALGFQFLIDPSLANVAQAQGMPNGHFQAQLDELTARLAVLETHAQPLFLTVDCAAGQTVAGALAQAVGFRTVTITIVGLCQEQVTIGRDDVVLQGASPGDGLQAPAAAARVLRLVRANRIRLRQLTIVGGTTGLVASGGSFSALDVRITGAARDGILMDSGGTGTLIDTIIENAGDRGVAVSLGASLQVTGSGGFVRHNAGFGLVAELGGRISLSGGATAAANGVGMLGFAGGVVHITGGAIVETNTGNGVELAIGSILSVNGGAIIRGNAGHGISVRDTSVAELGGADLPPQIINNERYGIACAAAPGVAQIGLGVAVVTGNVEGQVNCPVAPLP